jgi:cysteine-rich repeat protein
MADGSSVKIEDVRLGDVVLGYDPASGKYTENTVLELESPVREDYYVIDFDDGTQLNATSEHPIFIRNKHYTGWASINPDYTFEDSSMAVEKINVGDSVFKDDGTWTSIKSFMQIIKEVRTYNLKKVTGTNTFFAGGILVHNKGGGPPPPPPPVCGDGSWQPSSDKACEYSANPIVFRNNGAYTGNVCQEYGQPCRSGAEACTCCGDSVKQTTETCDLGPFNGADPNNDDVIGPTECRRDCTFCGDGIKQGNETCDLDGKNGIDTNNDGTINAGECRLQCTFCGDNVLQSGEICDHGTNNGIDINNNGIIGKGECRTDCAYCGDGIKQPSEECDDGNDIDNDFCSNTCKTPRCGDGIFQKGMEFCDYAIPCPISTGCTFSNYRSWNGSGYFPGCTHQCKVAEVCNKQDDNGNCYNINSDMNENNIVCDCCLFGSAGCCDSLSKNTCNRAAYHDGDWVCDVGVDEGFFWGFKVNKPDLGSAVSTDVSLPPTSEIIGTIVTDYLKDCNDNQNLTISEFPKYIYLTWSDLMGQMFGGAIPGTESLEGLEFTMTFRTRNTTISAEWYDGTQWTPLAGCGTLKSATTTSIECILPDGIKTSLPDTDKVVLRLVIEQETD